MTFLLVGDFHRALRQQLRKVFSRSSSSFSSSLSLHRPLLLTAILALGDDLHLRLPFRLQRGAAKLRIGGGAPFAAVLLVRQLFVLFARD